MVVHAAADGIALGAAAATNQLDVEIIVFLAIMLHKAPAAFGLVTFLLHEGLDRNRARKHLLIFSVSAPLLALITFICLSSGSEAIDGKVRYYASRYPRIPALGSSLRSGVPKYFLLLIISKNLNTDDVNAEQSLMIPSDASPAKKS